MKKKANKKKDKAFKYLKFILIVFLFNVLPIIFVFMGLVYVKVLEIQTDDVSLKIDNELKEMTLLEKENLLNDIYQEILMYVHDFEDYNNEIGRLDTNIEYIKKNNIVLNNEIKNLESNVTNLQNENNELNIKYKEVSNHTIQNVITINQYPLYPNGCEAVALTILLRYHGINVNPESVMNALPKGDIPHYENGIMYGGNPNYEFLGNPRSIYGWGIWDKGLQITANKFKYPINNGTGMDFKKVIRLVKNNRPVVVWTSIDLINPFIGKSWIYKLTGEIITWKNYNHAVVVIGYTENNVIISDPINGQIRSMNRQTFINVYNYMGRKALYY